MSYFTIYTTSRQTKIIILKQLFEEHRVDYRVLKEPKNSAVPVGFRVQVTEKHGERAKNILKNHGFLGTPEPAPDSHMLSRFWIYLSMALFLIVIISILIKLSGLL